MERWFDEWQGGPLDGSMCEQGDLVVCCVQVETWVGVWWRGPLDGSMYEPSDLAVCSESLMVGKQRAPQAWSETGRHKCRVHQVVHAREDILPSVLQLPGQRHALPSHEESGGVPFQR